MCAASGALGWGEVNVQWFNHVCSRYESVFVSFVLTFETQMTLFRTYLLIKIW